VRSLEILRRSGQPPSAFPFTEPHFDFTMHVLAPPTTELRTRIVRRARRQFEDGLVAEVAELLRRYPAQPTALQAIGYKEVARYLRGEVTLELAQEDVVNATARYAKRQRTW